MDAIKYSGFQLLVTTIFTVIVASSVMYLVSKDLIFVPPDYEPYRADVLYHVAYKIDDGTEMIVTPFKPAQLLTDAGRFYLISKLDGNILILRHEMVIRVLPLRLWRGEQQSETKQRG